MNSHPLPYHQDSTLLFEALRHRPHPALLDSGFPGSPWGRFDILCAEPSERIVYRHGIARIVHSSGAAQEDQETNPFALLEQLLDRYPAVATDDDTPFCGGAVGYFSYDLGRCLEELPNTAIDDLSLPEFQVGIYQWAIIVDHQQQRSRLVSATLTAEQLAALADDLLTPTDTTAKRPFRLRDRFQSNLSETDYQQRFKRVKAYIDSGDCYQVNLAQRFSAGFEGDPWHAYCHLRQHAPTPFSAYLENESGSILSLSPERFLSSRDGAVETRPIKGTRPRAADKETDRLLKQRLQQSPKDRAENLMIVDLLRNDLGRTCAIGSVRVPELFKVESYANVHHLVSTITGTLSQPRDAVKLLAHCFPGGSITGAPKIRAMEIIEELEPHRRGPYCGSIGYIGFDGRMDTSICIRTLVADNEQIHCWAGGGIVADSDCAAEYQETFDKICNLLGPLEAAFLAEPQP